jgi:hypothetical protein
MRRRKVRMNRTMSVERLFSLGNYENLKVSDVLTDVPEEIALDPEEAQVLRNLQLVDIEHTWLKYAELKLSYPKLDNQEAVSRAIELLEEQRRLMFEKLSELIKAKGEK